MISSEIISARLLAQINIILLFCGKKQILTEISYLSQATLETKYNRPLPMPRFFENCFHMFEKSKNLDFFEHVQAGLTPVF